MAKKKSTPQPPVQNDSKSKLITSLDLANGIEFFMNGQEALHMNNVELGQAIHNNFFDTTGFTQFDPFNFPESQTFPGTQQVSNIDTVFRNLRFYLVSNFRQILSQLYVEIGIVQTLVDLPVDDAFRGGVEIKSKQLEEEQIEALQVSMDRDQDLETVAQTAKWNRLFGGAGTLVLTDQDPTEPFDLSAVNKDTSLEFRAVDMWELFWDKQNTEGYDPSLQEHNFEFYRYYGEDVHKSRVMRMVGMNAPSFIRPRLRGWGFSIVEHLVRSLNQYLKSVDLTFEVLDEFKVDVYKIKNLVNTLLSPNGYVKVAERIHRANRQKNFQHAIVLDSEDDFGQKQLSFAGLAEAQAGIRKQICADLRFPATKLFGSSETSGLGNADQNDMENYNSMVEAQVRNKVKYQVLRILEIKSKQMFGFVPDDLSVSFKPLRILTAEQEENVKTQQFNRVNMARERGEITSYEFRECINRGNLLPITLDNAGDLLNPDDPQVRELVTEGTNNPNMPVSYRDPGSGREETRKTEAVWEYGGTKRKEERKDLAPRQTSDRNKELPPRDATTGKDQAFEKTLPKKESDRKKNASPPPFKPPLERYVDKELNKYNNSPEFDRASYDADGGDSWIASGREEFFKKGPLDIPSALWAESKQASLQAMGTDNWKFRYWWVLKHKGHVSNEAKKKMENPGNVDEALWEKAKKKSMSEYGEIRWPFVSYLYEQLGGTFG